jgi:hypothetical protein
MRRSASGTTVHELLKPDRRAIIARVMQEIWPGWFGRYTHRAIHYDHLRPLSGEVTEVTRSETTNLNSAAMEENSA